jgi:hypothetical protein
LVFKQLFTFLRGTVPLCCLAQGGPRRPKEAQGGPRRPKEAQGGPRRPKASRVVFVCLKGKFAKKLNIAQQILLKNKLERLSVVSLLHVSPTFAGET